MPPEALERKLWETFARVRAFVAGRFPRLAAVVADWCPNLRDGMRGRERRRAFMHTAHRRRGRSRVICVWPGAAWLSEEFLVGLFLHEFGHCAVGASETKADAWVFAQFGITVLYGTADYLEYVPLAVIARERI